MFNVDGGWDQHTAQCSPGRTPSMATSCGAAPPAVLASAMVHELYLKARQGGLDRPDEGQGLRVVTQIFVYKIGQEQVINKQTAWKRFGLETGSASPRTTTYVGPYGSSAGPPPCRM